MRKFDQRGFAPLETALILVIVGLLAFIAWFIFHSQSNTNTTYGNAAIVDTPIKQSTGANVVQTKTDSKLGKYLADASGAALYTYGQDSDNTSNCTGSCLTDWPVYKATVTTNLPDNVGTITRADGTKQYTYKKMPLYTFTSDKSGKVTGDGVGDFSVAKP